MVTKSFISEWSQTLNINRFPNLESSNKNTRRLELGRGLNIKQAKEELNGVTLESLVVAERVAKAVRVKAERGLIDLNEFPLLMHIDEIITQGKEVNIPWEKFTFEK